MSPITLPIAELKPALTGLAKVINRHSALPVLSHLKIERAADGWVALTATDLDHFVTVRMEQPSAGEAVSLLVPYDELLKISKGRGKDEEIFLESTAPGTVLLRSRIGDQFAETKITSLPVEKFPESPSIQSPSIPVDATLRSAIHEALECASTDETRLILNGAFVDVSKPNAHYVVGTDGRHLFSSNSFALPLKDSLLIPAHRFLQFKEFNADGEWQLQVNPKDKGDNPPPFEIRSRRWRFLSRQIQGNYPNWRQVVPSGEGTQTTLEVDSDSVESILQTIARMPDYDAVNHALGLEVKGSQVRLLGKSSSEDAWTRVEIPGVKIKGTDVTVHLNRHFLAKALRFGLTRIEMIDPLSPVRFSQGGRQMIVMPTRADAAPSKISPPPAPAPVAAHEESLTPNPPPEAEQPKEETMPHTNDTPAGASTPKATPSPEKPALETALAQVEIVRGDLRNDIAGLNKLGDLLKQAQRENKASEKDVQSVRQTLRSLQSVRI